jgi:hypothetical protein
MARIKVPFTGITTRDSHADGECRVLLNARPKDGVLKAVAPRKKVKELGQVYDIVFVHQNSGYENWIGVKHAGDTSSVYSGIDGTAVLVRSGVGRISSVQQVGNILSFVTPYTVMYALYVGGAYNFLGEMPEIPFRYLYSEESETVSMKYSELYGTGRIEILSAEQISEFNTSVKAAVNHMLDVVVSGGTLNGVSYFAQPGALFDAHLVRFAYRLYDGSYSKHSPVILLMPKGNIGYMKRLHSNDNPPENPLKEKITLYLEYYFARIYFDLSGIQDWKEIITSVDVFMSPALGFSSVENSVPITPAGHGVEYTENIVPYIKKNTFDSFVQASNFYLVKSIELSSLSASVSLPEYKFDMSNILNGEQLSDDSFSHDKTGCLVSSVYNHRLHMGSLKTTVYGGYPCAFFKWGDGALTGSVPYTYMYNGSRATVVGLDYEILVEVHLKYTSGVRKVYSSSVFGKAFFLQAYFSYPDTRASKMVLYRKLSAGSYRKLFEFTLKPHNYLNISYYVNYSVSTPDDPVYNISPVDIEGALSTDVLLDPVALVVDYPSKMKVSELDNPFLFLSKNFYEAGNGAILFMASNAIRISEGQFGEYPLYVGTTQGIYSMSVGDSAVYSNSSPTSYEMPLSGVVSSTPFGVVFLSKRGVCVISGQEVLLLSSDLHEKKEPMSVGGVVGSRVSSALGYTANLSDYLQGVGYIFYNAGENEVVLVNPEYAFGFVYNATSKLWYLCTERVQGVVENTYPDLYVLDGVGVKDYSQAESPASDVCVVTRPLRFETTDKKRMERLFLRASLRNMNNGDPSGKAEVCLLDSNDGVNFKPVRGFRIIKDGSYKDVYLGMFAREKARYFLFVFSGMVDEGSIVGYLDAEVVKEYGNETMR